MGAEEKQNPAINAGQRIQNAGNGISKVGSSFIWIFVGLAALLLVFLVL